MIATRYTRKAMEKAGGYEAAKKTFQNLQATHHFPSNSPRIEQRD